MTRQHLAITAATIASASAAMIALAQIAGDTADESTNAVIAAESAAAPTNAVPAEEPSAALREEDVDEIDLEEIDDTAEAAKRPQIRTNNEDVEFVDISCDEATLADVLRQFRKTTRANIISDDSTNLQRRVSAELKHVRWLDALQSILNARGFRLERRDNIYFVNEDKMAIPIVTKSFQLNHASAEELAALFNENYAVKGKDGKTVQKIANAFPGANVVVVTAPEKVISDCESIIRSVDKAVDQIYIEARFIELSSEAMHSLGFDWSQLKSWGVSTKDVAAKVDFGVNKSVTMSKDGSLSVTDSGSSSSSSSRNGSTDSATGSKASESGSSYSSSADKSDGLSSSSSSERTRGHNGSSGNSRTSTRTASADRTFSGTLSVDDFRLAISAFESLEDAKIFSNPKVIVSNGKEAKVDMTTKYPYIELTSQRNTSSENSYLDYSAKLQQIPGDKDRGLFAGSAFFSYGIELTVKPRISPDGLISVEIIPSISYVDEYYSVANGSNMGADSSYGKFPIIKMKSISTQFTMKDGSTAVIGGLSKTEEEDVDDGIPYLRRLPWIGQKLFGSKSRQKVQYEIIICVTVGIARPDALPKDIGLPKNAVIGREYVEGRRLEPGDRPDGAADLLSLDLRSFDRRNHDAKKAAAKNDTNYGSVTVTPSANQ